ncbi:hypothetical protein WJX74_004553 [Apatococcus lobatus]|uniref:FAD-binding domain-containing protein n=1 Tax=Apatococcus lobatus TaxID=904363 RepID=A0AAW1RYN3_9CHLO
MASAFGQTLQSRADLRAVVIGAGPAGSVSAAFLARRGFQVDVFERRPQPTEEQAASYRSYPMLLSMRSLQSIDCAGLHPAFLDATCFKGRIAVPSGSTMMYSQSTSHIVHRHQLGMQLISAAQDAYPGQIRYHFDHQLDAVDFAGQQASFVGEHKQQASQHGYDLLIGADGANSRTRELLQAIDSSFHTTLVSKANCTYKTFHELPSLPSTEHFYEGFEHHQPYQHMYTMMARGKNPRIRSISMWKNSAGRMCGMAALFDWHQWGHTPEELASADFPIPPTWLRAIGQQFDQQEFNPFGRVIKCSKICGQRAVLVGDAAHAVTSVMGQGCNTALSTCAALDRALAASSPSNPAQLDAALQKFNAEWLPEAHALQRLEFMAYLARANDKPARASPLTIFWTKFLMTTSTFATMALHKLYPKRFPYAIALFQELQEPSVSYTTVMRRIHLRAAGFAVAAAAVLSIFGFLGRLLISSGLRLL